MITKDLKEIKKIVDARIDKLEIFIITRITITIVSIGIGTTVGALIGALIVRFIKHIN